MDSKGKKKPSINGPRKDINWDNCLKKFEPQHENIGLLAGKRSKVGVLDIDNNFISLVSTVKKMSGVDWYDADVHRAVIAPKVKSSTERGFHLYFICTEEFDVLSGTTMIIDQAIKKEVQIDFLVRSSCYAPSFDLGWLGI